MKLLFVIVNLEKGGAQRVMLNLCHSLNHNHTIEIVGLRGTEIGYPIDNLNIRFLEKTNSKNRFIRFFNHRKQLKRIINEGNYDEIISFLPEANFMTCSINNPVIKIINVRNDPTIEYRGIYYLLMRYFYPKADELVVQTDTIKDYFKSFNRNIAVIPNPVSDIPKYNVERKPIILNVGRLVPQKNQALLIRAFKQFNEIYPDYECHIYGEGRLKNDLNELIVNLGLDDKVKIFEPIDSIFERMQEAQVFVLSSDYEGYPNVLLEAMACGCAVISTDCASGGPSSIIQHNENGILVPVNDENALYKAMIQCANNDIQQIFSKNAQTIKKTHANAIFINSYTSIIESFEKHYVKD